MRYNISPEDTAETRKYQQELTVYDPLTSVGILIGNDDGRQSQFCAGILSATSYKKYVCELTIVS